MNTECSRIADQLAAAINGEAWYGDSLREILKGITAKEAHAHPVSNAHSIWELVLHVEAWIKFFDGAIAGKPIPEWAAMPQEVDWPPVSQTSEEAWQQAVSSFFSSHQKTIEAIKNFDDSRLGATVPGRAYNFYHLFGSAIQHAVYHGGQIALLKKALK
jgi:uncharacterized damage-inducible protein DinB